jgi:hypothetical protein
MRLASISDRGAARLNFQQRLVEIEQFWRPVPGHRNWAHELAIDVISLWLCGPSYLSAFNEVVSQPSINPFEIVQDHPPYAVRTWALLAAASDLGFASYGADLSTLERSWRKSRWDRKRDSRFLNLANRTLISECTQGAMEFCVHSNLRKCTSQALDRIRREVLSRASDAECTDDVGIDLVLLAWTVHREKGESAYEEWLTRQLRKLSLSLRQ